MPRHDRNDDYEVRRRNWPPPDNHDQFPHTPDGRGRGGRDDRTSREHSPHPRNTPQQPQLAGLSSLTLASSTLPGDRGVSAQPLESTSRSR